MPSREAERLYRSILIVCHANTSRSVMAEAMLKKMLAERDLAVEVRSAGIAPFARDGALVSMDARLALREEGIHVSAESVATDLKNNRHLIGAADLILAMTRQQIDMLRESFPEAAEKPAFTLKEFAGTPGDIEDPAGRDENFYAACRDEIKRALERALSRIERHG